MRVKVLKKSKGFLKIEVDGEGHTFSHLLQEALLSDKTVDWAGNDMEHPLFPRPTVTVRMKGDGSPEKAMERENNGCSMSYPAQSTVLSDNSASCRRWLNVCPSPSTSIFKYPFDFLRTL